MQRKTTKAEQSHITGNHALQNQTVFFRVFKLGKAPSVFLPVPPWCYIYRLFVRQHYFGLYAQRTSVRCSRSMVMVQASRWKIE